MKNESVSRVAFACDHRGYDVKETIINFLKKSGYEVMDCGAFSSASADYPEYMFLAAEKVSRGECQRAVGVCFTGIGSAIAANKVRGVRAALVHTPEEAKLSRAHNDANMLILGAGFLEASLLIPILENWFRTEFEGGRHEQRVNKIRNYEKDHG